MEKVSCILAITYILMRNFISVPPTHTHKLCHCKSNYIMIYSYFRINLGRASYTMFRLHINHSMTFIFNVKSVSVWYHAYHENTNLFKIHVKNVLLTSLSKFRYCENATKFGNFILPYFKLTSNIKQIYWFSVLSKFQKCGFLLE